MKHCFICSKKKHPVIQKTSLWDRILLGFPQLFSLHYLFVLGEYAAGSHLYCLVFSQSRPLLGRAHFCHQCTMVSQKYSFIHIQGHCLNITNNFGLKHRSVLFYKYTFLCFMIKLFALRGYYDFCSWICFFQKMRSNSVTAEWERRWQKPLYHSYSHTFAARSRMYFWAHSCWLTLIKFVMGNIDRHGG